MFSHLPKPTLDPILSLSVAYRGDTRTDKVDLGIGVYKNDQGETPIMKAVSMAQDIVVDTRYFKRSPVQALNLLQFLAPASMVGNAACLEMIAFLKDKNTREI